MRYVEAFIYSNHKGIRILRHLLFWITDIINYLLIISINTEINRVEVFRIIFRIPLIALATYFVLYYLIPLFSYPKKRMKVILLSIGVLFYLGVVLRYYRFYILEPLIAPDQIIDFAVWDFRRILSDILGAMVVVSMAIAIKVTKSKTELQQKNEQLSEEKKRAELKFLKAQMHPHFLFNTLNTLYADIIKSNGKSEEIILRLSNLLRFILEECNKQIIPLHKEVKVIDDYLALEKLRHGDRLRIDSSVAIDNDLVGISPLLLLPFVENSCKHSLRSQRGNIHIKIKITSANNTVSLFVENDLPETPPSDNIKVGVGIQNVRRQLELLYNNQFTLHIDDTSHKYTVNLKVPTLTNEKD